EVGRALGGDVAQTMAFTTLALSELVLVFAMRSPLTAAWRLQGNRWLDWSVAISVALVAAAVYVPATHEALSTTSLAPTALFIAVALSLLPFIGVEGAKAARRRRPAAGEAVQDEASIRRARGGVSVPGSRG
ncbi:MAG TPA: cation transporting ATPase C-terminal domain-containing protein, partial [Gaiellaceae bacterium]